MTSEKPISRQSGAEHYLWGGDCEGWHLLKRSDLSVIQEKMLPDRAEIRHYHAVSRQFFFVLSGELTLEIDGQIHGLRPHDGIEIAPGASHQARNLGAEATEFLVISHPTTRGDRIDEKA